jgi:tellurite resistance protein TehA-like permease
MSDRHRPGSPVEPGPGSFTLVMATGILSVAAYGEGVLWLSWALLAVASTAYALLAATLAVAAARRPRVLARRLVDPSTAFESFALTAATSVLGVRWLIAGWQRAAEGLWITALVTLAVTGYVVATALSLRPTRVIGAARGGWLLGVVATQSVAVLGASLALLWWRGGLAFVSLCLWLVGLALYGAILGVLALRHLLRGAGLADYAPDHWIAMGALAISCLAGTRLLAAGLGHGVLDAALPLVAGLTVATWAVATAWCPWLAVTQGWRAVSVPGALRYGRGQWWAMVFPVAMYGEATRDLDHELGLPVLGEVAATFFALGLVGWMLTAAGLLRASLPSRRAGALAVTGPEAEISPEEDGERPEGGEEAEHLPLVAAGARHAHGHPGADGEDHGVEGGRGAVERDPGDPAPVLEPGAGEEAEGQQAEDHRLDAEDDELRQRGVERQRQQPGAGVLGGLVDRAPGQPDQQAHGQDGAASQEHRQPPVARAEAPLLERRVAGDQPVHVAGEEAGEH